MFSKVIFIAFFFIAINAYAGDEPSLHLTGNAQVDFFGGSNLERKDFSKPALQQSLLSPSTDGNTKSPWIAGLLSLAVPGAGEWYDDNKTKGAVFFGVEVVSWVTAYMYDKKGDKRTDEFEAFANEHYSASRYALWTLNHLGQLNPTLAGSESTYFSQIFRGGNSTSGPPFSNINWDALNSMERALDTNGVLNGYTHEMPYWNEQQYYELIGKYDQFSRGWDDANPTAPINPNGTNVILSNSARFYYYAAVRASANHFYDISATFVSIAIINHIVSALDAFWTTSRHNNALHAEVTMHLQSTSEGLVPVSEAKIQYSF